MEISKEVLEYLDKANELEVKHMFYEELELLNNAKEELKDPIFFKKYDLVTSLLNYNSKVLHRDKDGKIRWSIDENGLLILAGNGDFRGEYMNGYPSWYKYRFDVKTAIADLYNCTSCLHMFDGCIYMTSVDISHLDTSNLKNACMMFDSCASLTSIDFSNFDTSKNTTMHYMFFNCKNLKTLDLSGFDTKNVNNMWNTFGNCSSLKSLDLSNFNTDKVTNMNSMFDGCTSLESLDLSSFNSSNVGNKPFSNMYRMFCNCKNLKDIKTNDERILTQYQKDTKIKQDS